MIRIFDPISDFSKEKHPKSSYYTLSSVAA